MATEIGWTEPLVVARLHTDPSGVLEASTTFQALLFPGMSTQTARLHYISLFAAARYYRMEAGSAAEAQLPLSDYLRRLEALIAVSSVCHHIHDNTETDGIEVQLIFHKLSSIAMEKFDEHFKGIFDGHGQVPTKGLLAT
jgi:hypothetical protein